MAFHVNEPRVLKITLDDQDIIAGPGSYDPKHSKDQKSFNKGKIPFGSAKSRKILEKEYPELDFYHGMLAAAKIDQREKTRKENILKGEFCPEINKKEISSFSKRTNFCSEKRELKIANDNKVPGPGAYHNDSYQTENLKSKQKKEQENISKSLRKKRESQLIGLLSRSLARGPSIPDKSRVYGYHLKKSKILLKRSFSRTKPKEHRTRKRNN